MDKINKMFKGIYIAMGIAGVVLAILALLAGYKINIFSGGIHGNILIVFTSLSVITMLSTLFNNTLFENADQLKLTVIRGHIALYFGFSSYLVVITNNNDTEITSLLAILAFFAVYIVVMVLAFFWFIKRIEKRIKESEKK